MRLGIGEIERNLSRTVSGLGIARYRWRKNQRSAIVEALAVKLTQNEGELIQEKFEVKKLGNFLKQASEDAKKLVNQEKSFACAEIESARAVVLRIGEAFEEQERNSEACRAQGPDVEKLVEEVRRLEKSNGWITVQR